MVFIQYLARLFYIQIVLGYLCPGEIKQGVNVIEIIPVPSKAAAKNVDDPALFLLFHEFHLAKLIFPVVLPV